MRPSLELQFACVWVWIMALSAASSPIPEGFCAFMFLGSFVALVRTAAEQGNPAGLAYVELHARACKYSEVDK